MEFKESAPKLNLAEKYASQADSDGFLKVNSFSMRELRRQSKSVAGLLDGEEGTSMEYNLGDGLHYKGNSGNYPDMKIHIGDLDEFVRRVREHYGE